MHAKWIRVAPALLGMVILVYVQTCSATINGDIELLRLVATAHQANRAAVDTWQGHAHVESTLADANGIILQDTFSTDFLSDCRREVTRWTWTQDKRHVREGLEINGEPVSKGVLEPFSAMITRAGYYRHAPGITTRDGRRLNTLVIWPPERARRRSYSECFNPMWYLTGHMTKLTDDFIGLLVFLYGRVKNDGATHIIATRDGDVVILERGNESLVNRHTFDLARGGNVVKYFAQSQGDTERREWTYEHKDDVWIPKTFVFNHRTKSPDALGSTDRTWKVMFVNNIVNEPIPVSQFTLKALGYKSGEQLNDQRTNLPPIYDGARTWEERLSQELSASPAPAPYEGLPLDFAAPLLGKPLPDLNDMNLTIEHAEDKAMLVCFFDLNQRPSRYCLTPLAKEAETLEKRGIAVAAIQASKVDRKIFGEWVKTSTIPFPVGMIQDDERKVRFDWAVRSLPWLILTDRRHIVVAEGFGLDELNTKLTEVEGAK